MARQATLGSAPFTGFADTRRRFFRSLAKNQSRDWFAAHKDEYQRDWLEPMHALLWDVRARLVETYGDAALDPPKVFRIHCGVRFARDKTPYKTHIGSDIPIAGRGGDGVPGPVALYLQLGLENYAGAGDWIMTPACLASFRTALLDERRGGQVARLLARLEKAGFTVGSHDAPKKVPRGFDAAHPRAELAKRKGLVVGLPELPVDLLASRDLVDWLAKHARSAAPLVEWLLALPA
ncbi:MAG: DUF2461 domain-containing protein [Deltaproteobacteria bacterium]|nr:DUF2461 domain-containing protein [Deltaproteobacteria bacterium]